MPVLALLASAVTFAAAGECKFNILHINADDRRADGLHALGNEVLKTPNLDKLDEQGMTFTQCYTMGSMIGAVCLPSRTMLLTGRSWLRVPGRTNPQGKAMEAAGLLPIVLSAGNSSVTRWWTRPNSSTCRPTRTN